MNIYEAQEKAEDHARKVFTEVDFKFQGSEKEIEVQMDKVFKAIVSAWAIGSLVVIKKSWGEGR